MPQKYGLIGAIALGAAGYLVGRGKGAVAGAIVGGIGGYAVGSFAQAVPKVPNLSGLPAYSQYLFQPLGATIIEAQGTPVGGLLENPNTVQTIKAATSTSLLSILEGKTSASSLWNSFLKSLTGPPWGPDVILP